MMLMLLPRDI